MSNFWKVVFHGIVTVALFGIPLLIKADPTWLNVSIGGLLTSFYQYLVGTYATPETIGFARK